MPEVPIWSRMCPIQTDIDHCDLFINETHCPFCRHRNPTPPVKVVQTESKLFQPVKPDSRPKSFPKQTDQVVELTDDESDNDVNPAAMRVTSRWADTQPDRTIANHERLIKAAKGARKEAVTKYHRDAGSAPISTQDKSSIPASASGLKTFKVTVQQVVGRWAIDEDDPDRCKTWIWKKHEAPTTVQTRDSRVIDQKQFIQALAFLVPIEEHIKHEDNTSLYIAFSFNEKSGPTRIAEHEFYNAAFLKLLTEFSNAAKNAVTYLVYVVAERRQPPLYSQDLQTKPEKPSDLVPVPGSKKTAKVEGQDIKIKTEQGVPIKKEKKPKKASSKTKRRALAPASKIKEEPRDSSSEDNLEPLLPLIKQEKISIPRPRTPETFQESSHKRGISQVSLATPPSQVAIRQRKLSFNFVQPPAHSTRSKAGLFMSVEGEETD